MKITYSVQLEHLGYFPVLIPMQFALTPKKIANPIFYAPTFSTISLCYTIDFKIFKTANEDRKY